MPKIHHAKSTFTLRQKRDLMYALLEKRRQIKLNEKRHPQYEGHASGYL